jgi:hypothetical protein
MGFGGFLWVKVHGWLRQTAVGAHRPVADRSNGNLCHQLMAHFSDAPTLTDPKRPRFHACKPRTARKNLLFAQTHRRPTHGQPGPGPGLQPVPSTKPGSRHTPAPWLSAGDSVGRRPKWARQASASPGALASGACCTTPAPSAATWTKRFHLAAAGASYANEPGAEAFIVHTSPMDPDSLRCRLSGASSDCRAVVKWAAGQRRIATFFIA